MHGFADNVLAQHWADWRSAIAAAGVGGGAGAFQLQIKATTLE